VRWDERRRTSPTKATKKKRSNARQLRTTIQKSLKRIEDNKNNFVFASSNDEEDDNDAVSSKSSGGNYKEDDLVAMTKVCLPAAVQNVEDKEKAGCPSIPLCALKSPLCIKPWYCTQKSTALCTRTVV
jgi:hypothetical protein